MKRSWRLLLAPVVIALALWPLAAVYRHRAQVRDAQRATQELTHDVNRLHYEGAPPLAVLQSLLERGANSKVHGEDNATVLHLVVAAPCDKDDPLAMLASETSDACEAQRVVLINRLVAEGADIDAQIALDGSTPLMRAVDSARPLAVRALLDKGAKVNLVRHDYSYFASEPYQTELGAADTTLVYLSQPMQEQLSGKQLTALAARTSPQQLKSDFARYQARSHRDMREIIAMLKQAGARQATAREADPNSR